MADRVNQDDEWWRSATQAAGLQAGRWLEESGKLRWRVMDLTKDDLRCIAESVIAHYIKLEAERQAQGGTPILDLFCV